MATRLAFILSLQLSLFPYTLPAEAPDPLEMDTLEMDTLEMLELVNSLRTEHKLHTLLVETESEKTAITHARELAQRRVLSHRNLNNQRVHHRYRLNGGTGIKAGENLGLGPSITSIFQAWLKSKTHRENILNTDWASIGIGITPLDNKRKIIVIVFTTSKWKPLKTTRSNTATSLLGLINTQNNTRTIAIRFRNINYTPIRIHQPSQKSNHHLLAEFQLPHPANKEASSAQLVFINHSSTLITDLILLPHTAPP